MHQLQPVGELQQRQQRERRVGRDDDELAVDPVGRPRTAGAAL
ncbi:hypothetical protein [Burkholderia ubonensis]|nr:hypothetical protein [Burkholderia ubonensis]